MSERLKIYNLTQTGQQAQEILNNAKNADDVLQEIKDEMQNLPDGQAVSAQVALNTLDIEGLQEDVSELGQEINGTKTDATIEVTSGLSLSFSLPFVVADGKSFSIKTQSAGGFWPVDVLGEIDAIDEDNQIIPLVTSPNYKNFSADYVATANIVSLRFYRSAHAEASGTIAVTASVLGDFATTEELNTVKSQLEDVERKVDSYGTRKSDTFNVTQGSPVLCVLPITIESGMPFRISGIIPRGLVSLDAYNVYAYKNAELTTPDTIYSGGLEEFFSKEFVKDYKIYGVAVQRGASAEQSGQIYLECDSFIFEMRDKNVVYVDATNGSDDNSGDKDSPFATLEKAMRATGEDTTIYLVGDVIGQNINLKTKGNQRSVTVIGDATKKNRIMLGTFISAATEYSGSVYYKELSSFPAENSIIIYQHEIPDADTVISDAERHPLQRGREYRCESTAIRRVNSVQDVVDATALSYYWDDETSRLYFKIKEGSSLADNPIVIPSQSASAVTGNDGSVILNMINVDAWYCRFDLSRCHGAVLKNCAAKYAIAAGGFIWNNAIGLRLETCEAARITTGLGTGDGFNAHSLEYSDPEARHTTCIMIDCWSHDNADDGYSDHERCECAIYGGLFEYNGKAGVTPSYGSHLMCYNVLSRKNYNGFYYVGEISNTEGGKYGQMCCYDCVARDNVQVAGFAVDGAGNSMKLVSCKSINNPTGYLLQANTRAELIDCGSVDDVSVKSIAAGATLVINNTNIVMENP